MLTDNDLDSLGFGEPGVLLGVPVMWVIDQECLYDLPLSTNHAQMFFDATEIVDISLEYPDHNGITVRLLKDNVILNELCTSEYFGNILLSNPQAIDMSLYPYGRMARALHSKFDGEKFIITDVDTSDIPEWSADFQANMIQ